MENPIVAESKSEHKKKRNKKRRAKNEASVAQVAVPLPTNSLVNQSVNRFATTPQPMVMENVTLSHAPSAPSTNRNVKHDRKVNVKLAAAPRSNFQNEAAKTSIRAIAAQLFPGMYPQTAGVIGGANTNVLQKPYSSVKRQGITLAQASADSQYYGFVAMSTVPGVGCYMVGTTDSTTGNVTAITSTSDGVIAGLGASASTVWHVGGCVEVLNETAGMTLAGDHVYALIPGTLLANTSGTLTTPLSYSTIASYTKASTCEFTGKGNTHTCMPLLHVGPSDGGAWAYTQTPAFNKDNTFLVVFIKSTAQQTLTAIFKQNWTVGPLGSDVGLIGGKVIPADLNVYNEAQGFINNSQSGPTPVSALPAKSRSVMSSIVAAVAPALVEKGVDVVKKGVSWLAGKAESAWSSVTNWIGGLFGTRRVRNFLHTLANFELEDWAQFHAMSANGDIPEEFHDAVTKLAEFRLQIIRENVRMVVPSKGAIFTRLEDEKTDPWLIANVRAKITLTPAGAVLALPPLPMAVIPSTAVPADTRSAHSGVVEDDDYAQARAQPGPQWNTPTALNKPPPRR